MIFTDRLSIKCRLNEGLQNQCNNYHKKMEDTKKKPLFACTNNGVHLLDVPRCSDYKCTKKLLGFRKTWGWTRIRCSRLWSNKTLFQSK